MSSICLIFALLMPSAAGQKPAPTYNGDIRLPVDLYSSDGTHLEKGEYAVQVNQQNGQYRLIFLQDEQPKGTLKGDVLENGVDNDKLAMPLIGTQFLRSSDDPVGSEAERHFSKTGLAQYEEEKRDWKATLRAYIARNQKQTLWFFEQRQPAGKWAHVEFKLNLTP
jgi:hypothetical protein